jgi:hypothetical protein
VDPFGKNGEFHTFAWAGAMLTKPVAIEGGKVVDHDSFVFADILPATPRV